MKLILKILILTILVSNAFGQNNKSLYPITNCNLWGYIDKTGKTIIEPQFIAAGEFSEGLAAVRLNGTYGYIDSSGNFLIKSQYDFALPFQSGLAEVFIDGKPFFIDRKGNIIFQHNFKEISSFGNCSYATAITQTNKYGIINLKGDLIVDTIFKRINSFIDGLAVVYGLNHMPYPSDSTQVEKYEVGVIDTTGKWIVPFGRYKEIGDFKNGYSKVELFEPAEKRKRWPDHSALIDSKGNKRFVIPARKYELDYGKEGFYNDVAIVRIYSVDIDTVKVWSSSIEYRGAINPDGIILFSDTSWREITPFAFNRAFAKDGTDKWKMINKSGKQIGDSTFDKILYDKYDDNPENIFTNGIAWVKLSNGWVEIDTTGKILSQPKVFEGIYDSHLSRVGNIIFLEEDISVQNPHYSYRYGFCNSETNSTVNPFYHVIDKNGFNNELIYAMKDGRMYYINSNGQVIWQGTESNTTRLTNLNIDFMNRGYFYAYSKPHKDDIGGFGSSDNFPKRISKSNNFQPDTLSVVVHPELKDTIFGSYNAITVYVANTTSDDICFNAQDSRLYMKVQALNTKGEWKDIEYLPSSWCGNSYHTLTLESKYFWTLLTPVYEGEFKTKFRIELKYIAPKDKPDRRGKKEITIYSNEYEGSINPGQYWHKREYYPRGIMDPYND